MKTTRRTLHCIVGAIVFATCACDVAYGNHYILPCPDECIPRGTWTDTGNLNTARMFHTATLLQDGRVLVVGGQENVSRDDHNGAYTTWTPVDLDSAELYDPATGAWTVTGRLSQPRVFHTATLLPDGRVLVVGGYTAEIYNPVTGAWTPTGDLTTAPFFHTATVLQNGKVLVAGGVKIPAGIQIQPDEGSTDAQLYDPAMDTWSRTGSLNIGRYAHTATLLQNGKVLVAGGSNDEELASTFDSAELYDPTTETWTMTGSLHVGRNSHTATQLEDGKILVDGGWNSNSGWSNSSELYDSATEQWSESGILNRKHLEHTATWLADGDVLVVGGGTISTERYSSQSGIWTMSSNLATSRTYHTATLLRDGRLLVVGGTEDSDNDVALATAALYSTGPNITGDSYGPGQRRPLPH